MGRMSFCAVPGLRVGHAHDALARTGVTVIRPDQPVVMAVDVRGGGPGTRETDALDPTNLVERVHALVLSGGSVFGLAAADAVALELARQGIGLPLGDGADALAVPVVPSAILFDLRNGGDKGWARTGGGEPPYRGLALDALAAASTAPESGAVGAGHGARAGSRAGGIGMASAMLDSGGTVSALVAVNSFGEVVEGAPPAQGPVPFPKTGSGLALARANSCIGVVATDLPLNRTAAKRMAIMAQDGLSRTIRPIHSPFDGDCIFALSTAAETPALVNPLLLAELGTRAADCVVLAVQQAVQAARGASA